MSGFIKKEENISDDEYLPAARSTPTKKIKVPRKKAIASKTSKAAALLDVKVKDNPSTDPNKWRASTVPVHRKITATLAQKRYRLKPKDLSGLKSTFYPTNAGFTATLYMERDVEREAWKRHGSPEAWDAYLNKLRQRYKDSSRSTDNFPEPKNPEPHHNVAPGVFPLYAPFQIGPTRAELALEPLFPAKWLWEACYKIAIAFRRPLRVQYEVLQEAIEWLSHSYASYPPRPCQYLMDALHGSATCTALR